jgi:hypothetical protein
MEIIKTIFRWIETILAIYTFIIALCEEHNKGGDAKKKEAIAEIKELVQIAVENKKIPSWLGTIFTIDAILNFIIDWIVGKLNDAGFFTHSETENTPG